MQDELLGSVALLPPGTATDTTDDNTPTKSTNQLPDNEPTAVVDKPIEQDDAIGAIGATGPPHDEFTRVDDVLMPSSAVREKLGGVSDMTLWRRLKYDPQFPRPIVMSNRRYWWAREIARYLEAQPVG